MFIFYNSGVKDSTESLLNSYPPMKTPYFTSLCEPEPIFHSSDYEALGEGQLFNPLTDNFRAVNYPKDESSCVFFQTPNYLYESSSEKETNSIFIPVHTELSFRSQNETYLMESWVNRESQNKEALF